MVHEATIDEAVTAARRGDRARAYQLIRAVLLRQPDYVPAWLWMSRVVEQPAHRDECLRRVLQLDPDNQLARDHFTPPEYFEAARQALDSGHAEHARELARQVLAAHPGYVPGQLLLEQLLDDEAEREELLNQVLDADPFNPSARDRLEVLRIQRVVAPLKIIERYRERDQLPRLGDYLVWFGRLTRAQIREALEEQRLAPVGRRPLLGEIVVRRGWATPQLVAHLLVRQTLDKFRPNVGLPPMYLGEWLIARRMVTPAQLEEALAEQVRRRVAGEMLQLGDLLVRNGHLNQEALRTALEDQRLHYFSRFA